MIMILDLIIQIEGRGSVNVGGIKQENYDDRMFSSLIGDRIIFESKEGIPLVQGVKDIGLWRSLIGDYIVGINVVQDIKSEDVKLHSPIGRYSD